MLNNFFTRFILYFVQDSWYIWLLLFFACSKSIAVELICLPALLFSKMHYESTAIEEPKNAVKKQFKHLTLDVLQLQQRCLR